jgi:hypothetical protein
MGAGEPQKRTAIWEAAVDTVISRLDAGSKAPYLTATGDVD